MKARIHLTTLIGAGAILIAAVALGTTVGLRLHQLEEGAALQEDLTALSAQNGEMVEAFFTWVTALKAQSISLSAGLDAYTIPILHWAELTDSGPALGIGKRLKAESVDVKTEEAWLKEVQARATQWRGTRRESGFGILRFRADPAISREWLGFLFAQKGRVYAVAVNPSAAFPFVKRFAARSAGGTIRSYLIGNDGQVVTHSQESYAGVKFTAAPIFTQALEAVAQGKRSSGVGQFEAIDRLPVRAAYARVGSLPLIWVTERLEPRRSLLPTGWRGIAGEGLIGLGALSLAVLGLAALNGRAAKAASSRPRATTLPSLDATVPVQAISRAQADAMLAGPIVTQVGDKRVTQLREPTSLNDYGFGETLLRQDLLASRETLRSIDEEKKILAEVEEVLFKTTQPDQAVKEMTEGVARMTAGPTLFFQFQETLRMAQLKFDAGFAPGQAPAEISFPLDAEGGEEMKTRLANHAPLARIILARLGIAHFEAWPVYRYSQLGRNMGKQKLHGVLVILQAGEAAYTRGDSIGRMIRSASLVYENTINAQ